MPSTITFLLLDPSLLARFILIMNGPSHLHYLEGTDECFELKCTYPSKVFSLLSKLCKSKATDLDMISARLLGECADLIADPLCFTFNQSIRSGLFSLRNGNAQKLFDSSKKEITST